MRSWGGTDGRSPRFASNVTSGQSGSTGIDTETGRVAAAAVRDVPVARAARAAASRATASGDLPGCSRERGLAARSMGGVADRRDGEVEALSANGGRAHKGRRSGSSRSTTSTATTWPVGSRVRGAGRLSKRRCRSVDGAEPLWSARSKRVCCAVAAGPVRSKSRAGSAGWQVDARVRCGVPICDPRPGALRAAAERAARLRWSGIDLESGVVTIAGGLVEVRGVPVWTEGKNARLSAQDRGRRRDGAGAAVASGGAAARANAGRAGVGGPRTGGVVEDGHASVAGELRSDARAAGRAGGRAAADVAWATAQGGDAHGSAAADAGELRAVADVLGHSLDMFMKTYAAHSLPDSIRAGQVLS